MNKLFRRAKQKLIADLNASPNRNLELVIYGVAYEFGMQFRDIERIYQTI